MLEGLVMGKVFSARYEGKCACCGGLVSPGDRIVMKPVLADCLYSSRPGGRGVRSVGVGSVSVVTERESVAAAPVQDQESVIAAAFGSAVKDRSQEVLEEVGFLERGAVARESASQAVVDVVPVERQLPVRAGGES